jgi:hypothetical protein
MPYDNFIGWSQQEKLDLLRGLQQSRLTGQVVKVQTPAGITEFDPTKTDIDRLLREVESSIANSPDYNANDPTQAACKANRRPGITRAVFY